MYILDVDNTLTPPRRVIQPEMIAALRALTAPWVLMAGSDYALVKWQVITPMDNAGFFGRWDIFTACGNERVQVGVGLKRTLCEWPSGIETKLHSAVMAVLIREEYSWPMVLGERLVWRTGMLNVCPIGRPQSPELTSFERENRARFVEHDQRTGYRQRMLAALKAELAPIMDGKLHVMLGGQTSFDICLRTKADAVRLLQDENPGEEMVYVGDAFEPDGNDYPVLSVPGVRVVPVKDWRETLAFLEGESHG